MSYSKEYLQGLPNLDGSTDMAQLKVSEPTERVWLLTQKTWSGSREEVLIEVLVQGKWVPVKRYPV